MGSCIHFGISAFDNLAFVWPCVSTLPVAVPEKDLSSSSSFLHLSLMWPRVVTTSFCIRLFRDFTFRESGDEASWLSKSRSLIPRNDVGLTVPTNAWSDGSDHFVISHIAISTFLWWMFLSLPNPDPPNFDMEYDQRSRSDLYLMAAIESRFRISRFRHSCGECSCHFQIPIHETP